MDDRELDERLTAIENALAYIVEYVKKIEAEEASEEIPKPSNVPEEDEELDDDGDDEEEYDVDELPEVQKIVPKKPKRQGTRV